MYEGYYHHDLSPFLIRFPEGWFIEGIRWYGLSYIAGFLIGWGLLSLYYRKGRSSLNPDKVFNLIFALILGVALGGRIGYAILYDWNTVSENPVRIFAVWQGGMASHGGMLGVAIALYIFSRLERLPYLQVTDWVCTIASAGIALGRLANFINGELWGKATDVSWAVVFREYSAFTQTWEYTFPRHPSQLYQAGMEGLLLFLFIQVRFWFFPPKHVGRITGEYLIGYMVFRVIGEVFREPDEGITLVLGMSRGTFYSLFLVGVAVVCIWIGRKTLAYTSAAAGK